MHDTVLSLENLTIGYRNGRKAKVVADGINASLRRGELVALVGRNGAGKSTLLRTLSAYIPPLGGNVRYRNGDVSAMTNNDIAKHISVVLTENVRTAINVRDLVSLGRTPYTNFVGYLTRKDRAAVDKAMDVMGIVHLEQRTIDTLSDGERQKCMVAKALAQETPLLLLDEPTAFLDFGSKVSLYRKLVSLARENGKAILVSTHDLELAVRLADRMWILGGGKLSEGCVEELSASGALRELIGDAGIRYDNKEKRIEIL